MNERLGAVLSLHGLAESEAPGIRPERVQVPFLPRLDEGGNSARDRVVVGEALLLLEPDEPGKKVQVARDQEDRDHADRGADDGPLGATPQSADLHRVGSRRRTPPFSSRPLPS